MLVGFGKASLIDKARQQPEKVQTDELLTTYEAVKSKLAQPLALGYCNVSIVGAGVDGFQVCDRVVSKLKKKTAIWFTDESNCWNFELDGDQKMIFARNLISGLVSML